MSQWCNDGKEMYKKRDARAKLLFVNINTFFAVLLAVAVVVGFVVIQK